MYSLIMSPQTRTGIVPICVSPASTYTYRSHPREATLMSVQDLCERSNDYGAVNHLRGDLT